MYMVNLSSMFLAKPLSHADITVWKTWADLAQIQQNLMATDGDRHEMYDTDPSGHIHSTRKKHKATNTFRLQVDKPSR